MLAAEFPNDNPDLHEGAVWVCLDVTGAPSAERRVRARAVVLEPVIHSVIATLAEPILPSTVETLCELAAEPVAEPTAPPIAEPVVEIEPPTARESGIFMTFSSLREDEEHDEEGEILVEELGPLEDAILEVASEPVVAEVVEAFVEPVIEPTVEPNTEPNVEPATAPVATIAPPPSDDPYVTFVSTLVDIAMPLSTNAASELPALLEVNSIARAWAGILRGTSEDWDAVGGSMLDEWAADTLAKATGVDAQTLKRELRARGIAAFGLAA